MKKYSIRVLNVLGVLVIYNIKLCKIVQITSKEQAPDEIICCFNVTFEFKWGQNNDVQLIKYV